MSRLIKVIKICLLCSIQLLFVGCAFFSTNDQQLKIMPVPEIYKVLDYQQPVIQNKNLPYEGVLYATDRERLKGEEDRYPLYSNERGGVLSVGLTQIRTSKNSVLSVESVDEYGVLKQTPLYGPLTNNSQLDELNAADEKFAKLINRKLELSDQKDIFIYIHGANNIFDNPPLVAGELWHYLDYEGVFISYAWPATASLYAYLKDTESAQISGHNLRLFLGYLQENTQAERIHLISHSAGGRVVMTALHQMALSKDRQKPKSLNQARIGHVILSASDYDPNLLAIVIADGLTEIPDSLSIYISRKDKALGWASVLFKHTRIGLLRDKILIDPEIINYFDSHNIDVIDVSNVVYAKFSYGHSYFRTSPWVSSDILAKLRFDLAPESRGLERREGHIYWGFPNKYPQKLKETLLTQDLKISTVNL